MLETLEATSGSTPCLWPRVCLFARIGLISVWEQLNVAISFNTTQVWILNVGDLKMLETPLEWFLDIAYDSSRLDRESLLLWLAQRSKRDFHADPAKAKDIAKLVADYSVRALYID